MYVTRTGNKDVDIILGDQLVAGFATSGHYLAIEHTQGFLNQLSKEQAYQQTGAVDDSDLMRLGKQFGVQYVCIAKTSQLFGDYYIASRLIDVEHGEVVNSYKKDAVELGSSQQVVTVAKEIASKLSDKTIAEQLKEEELARQKEAARQAELAHQREARRQELLSQGLVDLGLPSGTLWKNANEGGDAAHFTYDEAVSRFGNKLPTKQQFKELKDKCTWTWTGSGYKVTGPSGDFITLPAAGYAPHGNVKYVGARGYFWSSTPHDSDDLAWSLRFDSSEVDKCYSILRWHGLSVRLVQ